MKQQPYLRPELHFLNTFIITACNYQTEVGGVCGSEDVVKHQL